MVIYYYFRFVSAILKMNERMVAYTMIYSCAANNIQSYYICQRCVRVS